MQRKTNLILNDGSGTKDPGHNYPSSCWVSMDHSPLFEPDIQASISDPKLIEKMAGEGFIPSSFKVIFSEKMQSNVYQTPAFAANINALLADDGILLLANILPYDLFKLAPHFQGAVIRFPEITLLSKSLLSCADIAKQLANIEEHDSPEIQFLCEQLHEMQAMSDHYQLGDSVMGRQLLAISMLVINFMVRDEKPDELLESIAIHLDEMLTTKNFTSLSPRLIELCKDNPVKEVAAIFNMDKWNEELRSSTHIVRLCEPTLLNVFHSVLAIACLLDPSLLNELDALNLTPVTKSKEFTQINWQQLSFFAVAATVGISAIAINEVYKRTMCP